MPDSSAALDGHSGSGTIPAVYDLMLPERALRSTLDRPETVYVAYHNDAEGIYELLDEHGHNKLGHTPDAVLWTIREYRRIEVWETGARYRTVNQWTR